MEMLTVAVRLPHHVFAHQGPCPLAIPHFTVVSRRSPKNRTPTHTPQAHLRECRERSPVSGDLFAFWADPSIAARFPFSSRGVA
jgi:hypothetical protein